MTMLLHMATLLLGWATHCYARKVGITELRDLKTADICTPQQVPELPESEINRLNNGLRDLALKPTSNQQILLVRSLKYCSEGQFPQNSCPRAAQLLTCLKPDGTLPLESDNTPPHLPWLMHQSFKKTFYEGQEIPAGACTREIADDLVSHRDEGRFLKLQSKYESQHDRTQPVTALEKLLTAQAQVVNSLLKRQKPLDELVQAVKTWGGFTPEDQNYLGAVATGQYTPEFKSIEKEIATVKADIQSTLKIRHQAIEQFENGKKKYIKIGCAQRAIHGSEETD